jgi:hypothetical protein
LNGWDKSKFSTISGLRRRGYTANSIHSGKNIGVLESENVI